MVILAFDTSSALTSVALVDGGEVLAQRSELDARRHAEVLAPMLREVLDEAGIGENDVDVVACGVGPGPYTGLRVGIATARAVGLAWGRPVVGMCSLDAMAAEAFDGTPLDDVRVAADARRREVYWAEYTRAEGRVAGPWVMRPADIDAGLRALTWVGHGAIEHAEAFGCVDTIGAYPQAAWIARVVGGLLEAGAEPVLPMLELAEHGADGAGTASALAGRWLLAPEPLYLRRPDAASPVVVSAT